MRSLVQVQDGPFVFGGLAQLVERLLCKQDVSGSSPLTSIQRFRQTSEHDRRILSTGVTKTGEDAEEE